jgi:hypothetical protein
MLSARSAFELQGYCVLRSFLEEPDLTFSRDYVLSKLKRGTLAFGDSMLPHTPAAYGDPVMDTLLDKMTSTVARECGYGILPTYSYFRIYQNQDVLPKHKDRPACEISVSVCLGMEPQEPWPLWLQPDDTQHSMELCVGDAVLYKGTELWHWRNSFQGVYAAQVFLHYVREDGPNREWKFDKRRTLGGALAVPNGSQGQTS